MSFSNAATTEIQEPDIDERVLLDKSPGVHQSAADRNAGRFKVVETTMLKAFWYTRLADESISASLGLASARLDDVAFDKLPSGVSAMRARSKPYLCRIRNH